MTIAFRKFDRHPIALVQAVANLLRGTAVINHPVPKTDELSIRALRCLGGGMVDWSLLASRVTRWPQTMSIGCQITLIFYPLCPVTVSL